MLSTRPRVPLPALEALHADVLLAQKGHPAARARVFKKVDALVWKLAFGFAAYSKEPLEDLVQAGREGLCRGLVRWRPGGANWVSWAHSWAMAYMQIEMGRMAGLLAGAGQMSVAQRYSMVASLNCWEHEEDWLASDDFEQERFLDADQRAFASALVQLPPEERALLKRRLEGETLQEIGDSLGISRQAVCQRTNKVLRHLVALLRPGADVEEVLENVIRWDALASRDSRR